MITIYNTLEAARAARAALPTEDRQHFALANYVRATLDGAFAVISIPKDCYLSRDAIVRYNLLAGTLGLLDAGEPEEAGT